MRHEKEEARAAFESLRWPHGVVCPHCGGDAQDVTNRRCPKGQTHRCKVCRRYFSVTTNSGLHRGKLPLHKLLAAISMMLDESNDQRHINHAEIPCDRKTAKKLESRISRIIDDVGASMDDIILSLLRGDQ